MFTTRTAEKGLLIMDNQVYENTDVELWRKPSKSDGMSYYSPSIHVTKQGLIGINVGGDVYQLSIERWHELAKQADTLAQTRDALADIILRINQSHFPEANKNPQKGTIGMHGTRIS